MNKKFHPVLLLFVSLSLSALFCTKKSSKKQIPPEQILAVVAQDTIYVNDYIRRCEFAIRPVYCQENNIQDKRVCLNSLIAEKLFALEAESDSDFVHRKSLQARLQGIKEQAMREKLIRVQVVDKIHVPENEIQQAFINSKKTVHTEVVFIPPNYDVSTIYKDALHGTPLDELSKKYPGVSKKIKKDVKWGQIDQETQKAVFNDRVKKGTVLYPIEMKNGYRLIKVLGWSEEIELSPANRELQMQSIENRLKDYYIQNNYQQYAKRLMKGKRIDFYEKGWDVVLSSLQHVYLARAKKPSLPMSHFKKEILPLQQNADLPFFTVDHKVWTISDFRRALHKHPLEINTKSLTKENFAQRLQAAVAGLITDTYLTKLAYKKKYDQSYPVKRAVKDWKTHYLFLYARDQYLQRKKFKGSITKDYFDAFDNYLTPYFDSLKVKYNPVIRFNPQALDSLQLTRIPMVAYKTGGPYKQVVPPFPLVTNSVKCNYQRFK